MQETLQMYKILKPILFLFSAETAHTIIVKFLKFLRYIPLSSAILRLLYDYKKESLEREVFGIKFKNPVGLAAGFDKNAEFFNDMANFGFGFIELGSVTPEPQPGNPKPRCFRLPQDEAIINRMGINNKGINHFVNQLKNSKPKPILGGSISKNSTTSNEDAAKDFERSFALIYHYVDYIALNVSCPNVKDLSKLQDIEALGRIIDKVTELRRCYDLYKPVLLKLSPDMPTEQLDEIIDLTVAAGLDGVIVSNTTNSREGLISDTSKIEAIGNGGLSGAPLYGKTIEMIRHINTATKGDLPIIGVGGIMSPEQAKEMLDAGASLIQIYSGFIYRGPGFVKKILKGI